MLGLIIDVAWKMRFTFFGRGGSEGIFLARNVDTASPTRLLSLVRQIHLGRIPLQVTTYRYRYYLVLIIGTDLQSPIRITGHVVYYALSVHHSSARIFMVRFKWARIPTPYSISLAM